MPNPQQPGFQNPLIQKNTNNTERTASSRSDKLRRDLEICKDPSPRPKQRKLSESNKIKGTPRRELNEEICMKGKIEQNKRFNDAMKLRGNLSQDEYPVNQAKRTPRRQGDSINQSRNRKSEQSGKFRPTERAKGEVTQYTKTAQQNLF
ncbi:hypothetical protein C922_03470 [Plasmodium inui San Antonio 1]|uniref:Uncharacterized protein n=1 Tax=Plasmodium inui San Antonio 1 TaxID=1237626 RepID=W7A3Q3_9APIC|nr:hypothetical protein C922_03470 [Plasmodium inui San Antonio 1]EUD66275.1 hypothetical protein C922_03470 [Plasmodium inui San Antonio 1]